MQLEIAELGQEVLRARAVEVDDPASVAVQDLASNMLETLEASGGVGIAAPQVFASTRVIVVASRPNSRYPDAPHMDPIVMVNPKLLEGAKAGHRGWEGCLSIPGIRGIVPRYAKIAVSYFDLSGKLQELELSDFPARIFQHELDHLDGTVFLDRIESSLDLVTEKEFFRLNAK